jgi:putative transcriptional regulator
MDKKLFGDLLESVREAGRIRRGERKPSRKAEIKPVDVKAIRARTGLSQVQFARLICVPVRTLRNWEQGRRHPVGAAVALLRIIESDPEHALKALHKVA